MIMKDIPNYEGQYAGTDDGRIWSYKTNRFLKPADNGQGYLYVSLTKDGKSTSKRVNVLIAETFLGEPPADGRKYIVDHIDGNSYNNEISNLQYITHSENSKKGNLKGVKRPHRPVKCVETGIVYKTQTEAAIATGIHKYGISSVLRGKQKTAGNYHWEYADEN